ncbi:MAG: ECF transporter S component [Propionibacteriaceae bacterium]|nr:ECF transporter S component [Propionibacteriaceae bacterium]
MKQRSAVPVRVRSTAVLGVAALIGLIAFVWPLFVAPGAALDNNSQGPLIFALLLPIVIVIVVTELTSGSISPKALAMLGVVSALGTLTRPLGAGTAGIELIFFLLIIGGRVFGPGFGFLLGNTTLLVSALVTGGVGPWLPYQMLAAGFVGMGAALLPRVGGWAEIVVLGAYCFLSAFLYGWLMDLAFWPFALGTGTDASFLAGAPPLENVRRFVVFNVATSMGWNLMRAIINVVAIALLGPAMLRILRRAARRAHFVD